VDQLGVALLGLDHWYAAHDIARQLAESPTAYLAVVADEDEQRARWTAEHYGARRWTTNVAEALDTPGVSVVATLASTDRNVERVQAAASAGKHILSVKPMALDLRGADAIVAAVRAAGVHFFPLDCLWRLYPDFQRLKTWVDEGRIGRALRFTHTLNSSLPQSWPGADDSGWWLDPARVPGGAWLDHAIYAVDMARWLFGADPSSVSGVAANLRYPELQLEDYGAATFSFPGGAVALIEDTWTADRGYGFVRNEIIGSAGAICDDRGPWGRIAARGSFGHDGWVGIQPGEAGKGVIAHVTACLRGEAQPIATPADGRANLAACLAFYEAARSNRTVEIAETLKT
jgi:predicted dehydrogenase